MIKCKSLFQYANVFSLNEYEKNDKIILKYLISKKHKKVCTILTYIEHFLIWASKITGCISISAFSSLLGFPMGIANSAIGLKLCATTSGTRDYN